MKKFSIQWWLAGALALLFIIPAFVTVIAVQYQLQPVNSGPQMLVLQRDIIAHIDHWQEVAWQRTLAAKLRGSDENIVLLNVVGQVVYSNVSQGQITTVGQSTAIQDQEIMTNVGQVTIVRRDQHFLGMLIISVPQYSVPLNVRMRVIAEILFSSLPVLVLMACYMRFAIMKPLAAMSEAARMIASNNLDIHLPYSPIDEIAQVIDAFATMSIALRAAIYRQAELEQERRLFIGAIAHDLRTPLFSLRGYLEALQTGVARSTEQVTKYIALSQKKAEALERLIGDLFAYAQLEYLAISPRQEQVELGSLFQRIVDSIQLQRNRKDVHLLVEGEATSCLLQGDEHLLTRAVENMLDNAMRYTPVGGKITIHWFRRQERVYFTITDTGPGFTPDVLAHIFTPLYRGEVSRNRQTSGAGLGLTIARRILLAHAGDLEASNASLGGAQLTGWLPCLH